MDIVAEDKSHSVPVDLRSIAASIALASDALAAAADALAEAARAISDASGTPANFNLPDMSRGIINQVNAPTKSDNKDGSETNNKSGQVNQYGPADHKPKSKFERNIPATSTPKPWISISSDSDNDVDFVPLDALPDQPVPEQERPKHETNRDLPKPHDTPEQGLNNTIDALPPSPGVSTANEPTAVINQFVKSGRSGDSQSSISRLLGAMKSYPAMPPGRNYMRLEHPSDAFAFIAYMTLQANRVICLIPDDLTITCSELVRAHNVLYGK
ncbi:unnamed protein product [Rhizoctonia solani]|uniref:Uncharacterized protein n=1 Tax=Rhizoctonia solani TaxID=456999 RepID=A0A8H3CJU4_9AGAM|nr:unnamed protein product [Rhizoctonia solani]